MKRFTKLWGGGLCLTLLLSLFTIQSASAQQIQYAAVGGNADGDCSSETDPCDIYGDISSASDNTLLIQVRRAGDTVTIEEDFSLESNITFGLYARGDDEPVKGTIDFTGSVTLNSGGDFNTHKDATVHFTEIIPGGGSISNLKVARDITVGVEEGNSVEILVVDSLEVATGQTLTVGARNRPANLRVPLHINVVEDGSDDGSDQDSTRVGKFDVKGEIDGTGSVWIAHDVAIDIDTGAGTGFNLLQISDYRDRKKSHISCLDVSGGGKIHNDFYAVSAGNLCINLSDIGSLTAVGSVSQHADSITTDIVFKENVTVHGDVSQYNDARVHFEKSVTVEGDVILDEGTEIEGVSVFGSPNDNTESQREDGTCAADYNIAGVQFAASSTIEGDLELLFQGTNYGVELDDSQCDTQAHFKADKDLVTTVRDVIIENSGDIHLGVKEDAKKAVTGTHNLSLTGDLLVEANATIALGRPATSTIGDGLCSAPGLKKGNKLIFSGDDQIVDIGSDATLNIAVIEIQGDVEVKGGTLASTAVYVADGGELESEGTVQVGDDDADPKVPGELILAGNGLDGTLSTEAGSASNVQHLVYASGRTDEVSVENVDKFAINPGAGFEVDLQTPVTVEDLGLCSGELVLAGDDNDDTKTVTVTKMLEVKDGIITLDSSNPGDIGTDETKPKAAEGDGYILKYVTEGERTAGAEWFAPRKVAVDHKDAVIIVDEAKALVEGVRIFDGHLHLKGDDSHLVIGEAGVARVNPILTIDKGELHTNGNNVQVHGAVTVGEAKKVAKLMTDGGELHVLGKTTKKNLVNATALATLGEGGVIDVGTGALQLGPETTNKADGLSNDWGNPARAQAGDNPHEGGRPHVRLLLHEKAKVTGTIRVPKGSKQTEITGTNFDTIVFDGTKTPDEAAKPDTANWEGSLYINAIATDKNVIVDSLNASNGVVEFDRAAKATVTKNVAVSSAKLYIEEELKSLEFKGDLAISGTGGFASRAPADARKSLMIGGDYSQESDKVADKDFDVNNPVGARLTHTDKTVAGSFKVSGKATTTQYSSPEGLKLNVKGDFHFGLSGNLSADVEFSGKEPQKVKSVATLGNVTLTNTKGITLDSTVTQAETATLTLSRGVISGESDWVVTNRAVEADLVASVRATENGSIFRSSRLSYLSAPLQRSVQSAGADEKAGYLFPAGAEKDGNAYYRPLILQLPADEDATTVTVAPETVPTGATPSWPNENIRVPASGETLTLDAYADIFWRVEVGDGEDDELLTNPSIRVQAHGIQNVFESTRLRIVQWDCDWSNPRLAGQYNSGENTDDSFSYNGYIGGNLNLTQTGIALGSCSILGVAANGAENPIHLTDGSSVQLARVQFIHNAMLPAPVNLTLDGSVQLGSALNFQSATGYATTDAGTHTVTVQPVGAPESSAINLDVTVEGDKAYAVVANGTATNLATKILETRLSSEVDNSVEAIIVHGVAGAGAVNVRSFSPGNHAGRTLLASNLEFNGATRYISFAPTFHNIELISAASKEVINVYSLDLNGYQGETLVIAISGGSAVSIMTVDVNGSVTLPPVVTSVDDLELPTEFSLHGNYPNPFNPSTRIQFDLPESAQVSLQVVDMLGREVMALPAQDFEAGSNRSIELNATNLASGTYLYRMIASGAESQYVKTGRMTLVK